MEDTPQQTAYLLDIPEEVLYGYIFPLLEFGDLLRLRRVCQTIKNFSDDFIRNNFYSTEREINETDATFGDYIQRQLPTRQIYINNSGPDIFEDPNVPNFLTVYGDQITHLRVRHFATCITPAELHFFSSLKNLEHLELEHTDATQRVCGNVVNRVNGVLVPRDRIPFPPNFQNLKTLKLNEMKGSTLEDHGYAWDFIEFCTKLEYLKHPLYEGEHDAYFSNYNSPLVCVYESIEKRYEQFPEQSNLKFYDLENHKESGLNNARFTRLAALCFHHDVRLLNFDSQLLKWPVSMIPPPFVSMQNVCANVFSLELPNMNKLVIKSTAQSDFEETWLARNYGQMPVWPQLEVLDVTIDSKVCGNDGRSTLTEKLLDFLFLEKDRKELKELGIRFGELMGISNGLPVPRVRHITMSCGNVTKLTLTNWLGKNKQVSMFWEGLPLLEEVSLEECKMLGDQAFLGKGRDDPTFLKLTNLQKFTLKGLDKMPKVTDLIFKLVFRHLKIKQFFLQSEAPLKSITSDGIQSLYTGIFNECVGKFPFEGWSLDGVSEEAFKHLKSQFRASYMLKNMTKRFS